MRRLVSALGAVALLVGTNVVPAFAWPDILVGQPSSLAPGATAGYYIWSDDDDSGGLHLRTTGPGPRHVFRGVLKTDGTFQNVTLVRLEGDDGFEIRDGGKTLELRFETWDKIDGIDFEVSGATRVDLALTMNRRRIGQERIFLGVDNVHPGHNPLTIYR